MKKGWNKKAGLILSALLILSLSACTNSDFAPNNGSELTASSEEEKVQQHTDSDAPTAAPAKINPLEDDFKEASSAAESTESTAGNEDTGITNSDVRLHSSPGGSNVGTVPNNTQVTIIGKSGNWYQIRYEGKEGYIYGQYLTLSDGSNGLENGNTGEKE